MEALQVAEVDATEKTQLHETHPDLPPLNQGTISKIEAQYRELGHVMKVPSKRQAVVDDDTKLNLLLALEENPITPARTRRRFYAWEPDTSNGLTGRYRAAQEQKRKRKHACRSSPPCQRQPLVHTITEEFYAFARKAHFDALVSHIRPEFLSSVVSDLRYLPADDRSKGIGHNITAPRCQLDNIRLSGFLGHILAPIYEVYKLNNETSNIAPDLATLRRQDLDGRTLARWKKRKMYIGDVVGPIVYDKRREGRNYCSAEGLHLQEQMSIEYGILCVQIVASYTAVIKIMKLRHHMREMGMTNGAAEENMEAVRTGERNGYPERNKKPSVEDSRLKISLLDTVTLKRTRFESVEADKAKATEILNQLIEADFQHCFQQWKSRMERSRDRLREDIEGKKVATVIGNE
ncbi:hypothetical protein NQ318_012201 [Aromia moschata]|uniref:Uncharacterized protein n=1 Tax=Aromia moschata TaxID=1265417 RepID=A0AAV8Z1T4_9CUCU|nr:hypothetical protein NQ318_012201 [Aromia moschata]